MPDAYIDRRCNHSSCERKGHYVAMARCTNCAWEGYVWITLGHTVLEMCQRAECPRCNCRRDQGRRVRGGQRLPRDRPCFHYGGVVVTARRTLQRGTPSTESTS